ncbi:MAG TPA: hypothetical protein VNQ76_12685 [Planctomicrobium sp.]|nr:hypothetical protein [Planctomicrobium sp.]
MAFVVRRDVPCVLLICLVIAVQWSQVRGGDLIEALSSSKRAERIFAEQELIRRGELDSLNGPVTDAATRQALLRIRRAIQIDRAHRALQAKEPRDEVGGTSSETRPFTVADCVRISAQATLGTTLTPDVPQLIRVRVRLDVAPNVRPLSVLIRDADLVLSCDGMISPPFSPDGKRELTCDESFSEFTVNFVAPESGRPLQGTLKGRIQLRAAAGEETVPFHLNRPVFESQYVGGTEARLISVRIDEFGLETRLKIADPPGVVWESYQIEGLHRNMTFKPADGDEIPASEMTVSASENGTHTVTCRFPEVRKLDAEDQLLARLSAVVSVIELSFEVNDISVGIRE